MVELSVRPGHACIAGPRCAAASLDEDGGKLIEMAVVLPTFFLLLFALFSFATVLFGYSNATYSCRVAVRYASLHSTTSSTPCNTTCVTNLVTPMLYAAPSGGVTVATTYGSGNVVGSTVTVFVKIAYTMQIPFFSGLKNVSVGSTAVRTISR
jgi:Flp pilus assembly protein TadG